MINIEQEIARLENKLFLPVTKIDFDSEKSEAHLYTPNEELFITLEYTKGEEIEYKMESEDIFPNLKWDIVVSTYKKKITEAFHKQYEQNPVSINPETPYRIQAVLKDNQTLMLFCEYRNNQWLVGLDVENEIFRIRENQIRLSHKGNSLPSSTQGSSIDLQNKMLERTIEIGGRLYEKYLDRKTTYDKHEIKVIADFEKRELEIVDKLDKRDKIFKGSILVVCIGGLVVAAMMEVATSVAPILGVIIGLILKNGSISEYFSSAAKKRNIQSHVYDEE